MSQAWVTRPHPSRSVWVAEEKMLRATFLGTRDQLAPYLVPHRFETDAEDFKNTKPEKLPRAKLGFGVRLNRAYLDEIFGHVRNAQARHFWGPMTNDTENRGIVGRPPDGVARDLWDDATRGNVPWPNFFNIHVLEWILSGLGGFVLVDSTSTPASDAEEARQVGKRPFVHFVPWSSVEDFGIDRSGLTWIKILEEVDNRQARSDEGEIETLRVLYEMDDGGSTTVSRFNADGEQVGEEVSVGLLEDLQGQPTLPLIAARFGDHPSIPVVGTGLLGPLADIVIDIYNTYTETRAGFRDSVFALLVHKGPDADAVLKSLEDGSLFVNLGQEAEGETRSLDRLAADTGAVSAGLSLMETGLKAWAQSARRQAADAIAQPRSGVSLQAEFELDIVPLLRQVADTISEIETNTMVIAAQMADESLRIEQLADQVGVERSTEFRVEEEAARIARLVSEFREELPIVPAEMRAAIVEAWSKAAGLVDLDHEIEMEDGTSRTLRELIPERALELARREEREGDLRSQSPVAPFTLS